MPRTRFHILEELLSARVVAILRHVEPDLVPPLVEALMDGGIKALEITLNTAGALEMIPRVIAATRGRAIVGAGTVLDAAAATQAIMAGAEFIVAPNLREDVIRTAHRYGKVAVPGAMTPTEIAAAAEAGADLVKVFPAGTLGSRYFRELRGPLGHIPLLATGGVSEANAADFFKAGAVAIGVGGALTDPSLLAERRFDEVRRRAEALIRAAQSV